VEFDDVDPLLRDEVAKAHEVPLPARFLDAIHSVADRLEFQTRLSWSIIITVVALPVFCFYPLSVFSKKETPMPRKCSICVHNQRPAIEGSVLAGDSYRTVAQQFSVSRDAVVRHRRHMLLAAPNSFQTEHIFESGTLVEQLRSLTVEAQRLKEKAETAGDFRTALAAVRELCRIVELVAKLRGEIDGRAQINVMNFSMDAETARKISETYLLRHQIREASS
jgi:hypothetical protein